MSGLKTCKPGAFNAFERGLVNAVLIASMKIAAELEAANRKSLWQLPCLKAEKIVEFEKAADVFTNV